MTFLIILAIIGAGTIVYGLFSVVHYVQNLLWDYRQTEKVAREARSYVTTLARDLDAHREWHKLKDIEEQL